MLPIVPKGLAGMSASLQDEFKKTSLNPVLLDASGLILTMAQVISPADADHISS